jgi:hypothetical protein
MKGEKIQFQRKEPGRFRRGFYKAKLLLLNKSGTEIIAQDKLKEYEEQHALFRIPVINGIGASP